MRFHRGDAWGRGSYSIPEYAVAGSSDCGMFSDSPAPTDKVLAELEDFRKVLQTNKIRNRLNHTQSGNVFMQKIWVVVSGKDYAKAKELAKTYLAQHHGDTRFIHDDS